MLRCAVFVLAAYGIVNCGLLNNVGSDIEMIVVDNMTEYLQQNNAVILHTLDKRVVDSQEDDERWELEYEIGKRVDGKCQHSNTRSMRQHLRCYVDT